MSLFHQSNVEIVILNSLVKKVLKMFLFVFTLVERIIPKFQVRFYKFKFFNFELKT